MAAPSVQRQRGAPRAPAPPAPRPLRPPRQQPWLKSMVGAPVHGTVPADRGTAANRFAGTWHNGYGPVAVDPAADPFAAEVAAVNAAVMRRGMAAPVLLSFAPGTPAYRLAFVRPDGTCELQDPDDDRYPGHPDWAPDQHHAARAVRADLEIGAEIDSPFWSRVLDACGIAPHPNRR